MNLLLVTLAAAPVSFSSLVQCSERIVIAQVVAVTRTPRVSSTLKVELSIRGRALPQLEVPEQLEIGERGLFFLGREKTQRMFLTPRHPGLFVYSPTSLSMDGALARSARELPWPNGVPISEVMAALGAPDVTIARERGLRVISTTCSSCDLERTLEKQLSALDRPVACAEACVTAAWKARRPIVLRQGWAGIDSGGTEVFFGGERGLSRA